jgi:hypothetical protein
VVNETALGVSIVLFTYFWEPENFHAFMSFHGIVYRYTNNFSIIASVIKDFIIQKFLSS